MRSNESKKITYIPILVHRDGFPAITSSKNTSMVGWGISKSHFGQNGD
jgi:hypothetical protein